jgi:hypothetical protein
MYQFDSGRTAGPVSAEPAAVDQGRGERTGSILILPDTHNQGDPQNEGLRAALIALLSWPRPRVAKND